MSLVTAYSGALLLAALVGVLILLPRYLPGYRPAWKGLPLRSVSPMLRFSLANYLNGFLWSAPTYLFPIVVINILGEQAAADFYIAWLLTNTMTMFSTSLAISLFAEGSNASHQLFDNAKRSLWSGLLVTGLCVVGLFILARPILLMFGEEYSTEAVGLVRVLCLAVFLDVIPTNYMAIARVKKWMGSVIGIAAVRAVLALVAGVWLTTLYGPIGLGIAWVGAQIVAAGMAVVLMLSRTRKPLISILS
jgi:O-antigen/teichoic acid export membrane protein